MTSDVAKYREHLFEMYIPNYKKPETDATSNAQPPSNEMDQEDERLLKEFEKELPMLARELCDDMSLLLIHSQQKDVNLVNRQIQNHMERIEELKKKKMDLIAAQLQKIHEAIEKQAQSSSWGFWGKLLSWIASCFMIASGAIAIASGAGALVGTGLIVSGAALLFTQLANEFGLYEKIAEHFAQKDLNKKAKILHQLQLWSSIFTILASVGSIALGYAAIGNAATQAISSSVSATLQIGKGTTTIGEAITGSERVDAEGKARWFQGKLSLTEIKMNDLIDQQKSMTGRWKSAMEFQTRILKTDQIKLDALKNMYGSAAPAA